MKSTFHGEALDGEELIPLVYEELHRLAASRMANERPGHTLQATALFNEAYLRLVGSGPNQWKVFKDVHTDIEARIVDNTVSMLVWDFSLSDPTSSERAEGPTARSTGLEPCVAVRKGRGLKGRQRVPMRRSGRRCWRWPTGPSN